MTEPAFIHVFIGTKAQYIKTVPVIRELDQRQIPYRLIDSGQHGSFSRGLRNELGIRNPDYSFGDDQDVATIPSAIRWSLRMLGFLIRKGRLVRDVFPEGRVCVVHGDTPSTLLSALLARRAGLEVAHLEAGLRSFSYMSPFPEELIRVIVMKLSTVLFAPSRDAEDNLREMRLAGEIVPVSGNTVVESIGTGSTATDSGPVVVTIHRVENLHRRKRVERLIQLINQIAESREVLFVLHPPTKQALARHGLEADLKHPSVHMTSLMSHAEFVGHLQEAPFVITDGGSIQEECAVIGVPTLLWRSHTERSDGLGTNVVLGRFDDDLISHFMGKPEEHRTAPGDLSVRPSTQIVDYLQRRWMSR